MDDREEIAFQRDHDPLAETTHVLHLLAFELGDRRHRRAQYEGIQYPYALDGSTLDPCGERFAVDRYVGKLGHDAKSALVAGGMLLPGDCALRRCPCDTMIDVNYLRRP